MSAPPDYLAALSECLDAIGFKTMARDVLHESQPDRLARYERVLLHHAPPEFRQRAATLIRAFHLQQQGA